MVFDFLFFLYVQNFSKYKVNNMTGHLWPPISSKKWRQMEAFSSWTAVRQHRVRQHCSARVTGPACIKVTMGLDKCRFLGQMFSWAPAHLAEFLGEKHKSNQLPTKLKVKSETFGFCLLPNSCVISDNLLNFPESGRGHM